jgi:transketolase
MELFEQQGREYRTEVLPLPVDRCVSIEAGIGFGWERYAGSSIAIDRFGASAPGDRVLAELGLTPAAVTAALEAIVQ